MTDTRPNGLSMRSSSSAAGGLVADVVLDCLIVLLAFVGVVLALAGSMGTTVGAGVSAGDGRPVRPNCTRPHRGLRRSVGRWFFGLVPPRRQQSAW